MHKSSDISGLFLCSQVSRPEISLHIGDLFYGT